MVKSIYVEIDDLQPLLQWLITKPEGQLNVTVGGTSDCGPAVLHYLGSNLALAKWIYDKVLAGEFNIKSVPEGTDLPVGLVVED